MDIRADNLYSFNNFHINMSYPKKIVGSTIQDEYLPTRENFRYKKVNILMGTNATGKTSLGRLLMLFTNYLRDGALERFIEIVDDKRRDAKLIIDFASLENRLYRFELTINFQEATTGEVYKASGDIHFVRINCNDNYEKCKKKLDNKMGKEILYNQFDEGGWSFSYPQDEGKRNRHFVFEDNEKFISTLENVLTTLDPSIQEVVQVKEIDNTYAIKFKNQSILLKDGEIEKTNMLSSGTRAGIDISYNIAALMCDLHDFFYCDELFSYINSDIEKACLSIMIEKLTEGKQLFFTTHNTDILDMQLPKHSFMFLRKDVMDGESIINCINAEDYLKRNTDSLKHAVENDLFCTAPNLSSLYRITETD